MPRKVRKAVFPVGGMGTRFFPATGTTPTEALPPIDTPPIQSAIDGARAAGTSSITDAIDRAIAGGRTGCGFRFDGVRYDCGSKRNFHRATVASWLARTDLREAFAASLYTMKALSRVVE